MTMYEQSLSRLTSAGDIYDSGQQLICENGNCQRFAALVDFCSDWVSPVLPRMSIYWYTVYCLSYWPTSASTECPPKCPRSFPQSVHGCSPWCPSRVSTVLPPSVPQSVHGAPSECPPTVGSICCSTTPADKSPPAVCELCVVSPCVGPPAGWVSLTLWCGFSDWVGDVFTFLS